MLACFFRYPLADYGLSMTISYETCVCIGLACLVWKVNKWVSMFFILALIAMYSPRYTEESYYAFSGVFYGVVWFYVVSKMKNITAIYDAICVACMINVALVVAQKFGVDPFYGKDFPIGFLGNPNHSGAFIAMCVPALAARRPYLVLPACVGVFLCYSSLPVMALSVGACFYLGYIIKRYFGMKYIFICAVPMVMFLLYTLVDKPNFDGRIDMDRIALFLFGKNGYQNIGLGHWKMLNVHFIRFRWTHVHCEYIQTLLEIGVLFVPVLVGYAVGFLKRLRHETMVPATAIVIAAVDCAGNFPFHIATSALLIITWMGVYEQVFKAIPDK